MEGTNTYPQSYSDTLSLIEKLAVQNIRSVKSANKIVDGFFDYDIENGKVIEESIIKFATKQAFNKNSYSFAATDPVVVPRYFNNYKAVQFPVTIRRDDIRAIVANKGIGVEGVVSEILDTMTQAESNNDFIEMRNAMFNADFVNYRSILGGVPSSMKGVLYALRDMYNHLKSNNSDLTTLSTYVSATPEQDIRIAVTPKLLNLIDVKELASIFNLEKEELFGKIVVVDVDDLASRDYDYIAFVYDRKALGRATRVYDVTQDVIGVGRYINYYLTVERAYFHNGLFKGAFLDCSAAATTDKATIIGSASTSITITKTLSHVTTSSTVSSVAHGDQYKATFVAGTGYSLKAASAVVTVTMGGTTITASAVQNLEAGGCDVYIPHVTGNVVITLTAA